MGAFTRIINYSKLLVAKLFPRRKGNFTSRKILEKNFPAGSLFRFIQVGAGDGISHDFLYDFARERDAHGIVIEPLPDIFELLVSNYNNNPNIIAINKAVHASQKEVTLYRVDPASLTKLPAWAEGIASLDPVHHRKSGIDISHLVSIQVPADHLMRLLPGNFLNEQVALLQIDVEGYDAEVLRQVDFTRLRPLLIRFEYMNLDASAIKKATGLLTTEGYHIFYEDADILAVNLGRVKI